jgi:hypothetical protein
MIYTNSVMLSFACSAFQAILQLWKHDRFDAYTPNTVHTAARSLPPGRDGLAASIEMLKEINTDRQSVNERCGMACVQLWLEAATICNLTYECKYTPGRHQSCELTSDIGVAWKQDSGATNCKRMAFIFDYYGIEVYKRAVNATHQDVTAKTVLAQLGIQINEPSADMRGGQKNCVQQQYSAAAKTKKNNILRVGTKAHKVRVNREQGKHSSTKPNWKRPKDVFFNTTNDPSAPSGKIVTKVSSGVGVSIINCVRAHSKHGIDVCLYIGGLCE